MAIRSCSFNGLGYDVNLVIATLPNFVATDTKEERREATMSAKVMGCKPPEFLDLAPDEVIFSRKFVSLIDRLLKKHEPEAVFINGSGIPTKTIKHLQRQ